jgi:hypothetical protein
MWEVLETMRVISQHGNVDLPYEQIVVYHAMESVIALYNGEKCVLGEYSSKEKAYKAMEMLREAWINEAIGFTHGIYHRNIIFQFPQDDEIEV